jgi:hypothetical protein
MAPLDLFTCHDFTDTTDQLLKVGDTADVKLGVVALALQPTRSWCQTSEAALPSTLS